MAQPWPGQDADLRERCQSGGELRRIGLVSGGDPDIDLRNGNSAKGVFDISGQESRGGWIGANGRARRNAVGEDAGDVAGAAALAGGNAICEELGGSECGLDAHGGYLVVYAARAGI